MKEDNAVVQMLDFLAADILHRPEQLQSLNWELIARITSLVGDVDVDLNAPLVFDDE
ncbi:type II toxin-antitoxin system PrlF family antitoxin [Pseudomonas sp. CVAP|uniref:type II toxin-antitoxin system PrlF family antitoxin n=1 Tax=Pseudomonas sp. CVAP\|nr:type II toxin-antitoxin system PrlF family antitoxin [Pseudomonas sp. CVAP\